MKAKRISCLNTEKRKKLASAQVNLESIAQGKLVEERNFMFEVDKVKAFKKLAKKQFKEPTLALRELVSNALDSYTETGRAQKVEIELSREHFEVTDYGTGFTEEKIECLRTLGQSDKRGERGYIGRFGIGFASIFNPDLNVKRVIVDTKVSGHCERLEFTVQETGVTLKRYELEETLPFSTRIRAVFENLDYEKRNAMEKTLRNEAKYMNAEIKFNGDDISGRELFQQTRKYMLDLEGMIKGRICFYDRYDETEKDTDPKVALLSHNVYVGSQYYDFIKRKKDFNLPVFFGFLNSDDLNVITSRNDFRKDEKYKAFTADVRRQVREKFRELCEEIKRTREPELRKILMQCFENNEREFFRNYTPSDVSDACAKALADAPIFTALNQIGAYSLKQLYEIGKKQGHLLFAGDAGSAELLEIQGYTGPIIRRDSWSGLKFKDVETFQLDDLYERDGQLDEKFYKILVDKGIIQPEKLETKISIVDSMSQKEQTFLDGLRRILSSERVKETLRQLGMSTEYRINLADITPVGVAACYSGGHILVNRKNPLSAQYIMEKEGNTAEFYLPVLAHELSHNILGRHDNPFYEMSDELSSKLAVAVAENITSARTLKSLTE